LHGFGGTRHAWDGVATYLDRERYRPLALDLPGHGQASADPGPITFVTCVERVLAASPERFALCGYSLGGRIALHVALSAPERITHLALIASSPGIEDVRERAERRAADRLLAERLEREPYEQFIESWNAQALFAGDPPQVGRLAREDQHRNRPLPLAASLRGVGTGEMPSLWGRLGELEMPVRILVGERDVKFTAIARRMAGRLADRCEVKVLDGGHRLPLESPEAVARELEHLHAERA
jgi:2-succinyl-6-hydroxy-2,4-cyclohexadiene-1-carboxylate synthase